MTELTADERQTLNAAMRSVGIAPGETGTAAQRHLAAGIAREAIETARPIGKNVVPLITKGAQVPDATKRAERISKLESMDTDAYSPAVRKLAGRQLALMKRGMSETDSGRQIGQEIIDELEAQTETRRALVAMRDGAKGADAPIVRKAAQMALAKLRDDTLASIKEHQRNKRGY
jgi:hypothetical protein